jgi:hypothetical protein
MELSAPRGGHGAYFIGRFCTVNKATGMRTPGDIEKRSTLRREQALGALPSASAFGPSRHFAALQDLVAVHSGPGNHRPGRFMGSRPNNRFASTSSFEPAQQIEFRKAPQAGCPVQVPQPKNIYLSFLRKSCFPPPIPRRCEGRIAIVTDVVRNAVDADVAVDERHGGGRRSRVVLSPRRWRQVRAKLKASRR